jgi:hypothetical protein
VDAATELKRLGIPEEKLRLEWAAQVHEQTKPAPRMVFLFFLLHDYSCACGRQGGPKPRANRLYKLY